ncbi:MAG TPA: hypothetical protein VGN14_13450 [Candidatus Elarobacter sp.]|jgi:hypothetical protein
MFNAFIHWWMVAFFAALGVWLIAKRNCFGDARSFLCGAAACDDERFTAAIDARYELENFPSAPIAVSVGITSLACGVAAAFAPAAALVFLYAFLCVAIAGGATAGYLSLRRVGERRIASLRSRDANAVVPWYVYLVTAIAAVAPLAFLDARPAAALAVTLAACVIALVARRVATLPALLPGFDPAVEATVDARLRSLRVVNLLGTAVAPAFVFISLGRYTSSIIHLIAFFAAFAALNVTLGVQIVWMRRRPSAAEIASWSHG